MTRQIETPEGISQEQAQELVNKAMKDSTGRETMPCGCWNQVVMGAKIENKCRKHSMEYVQAKGDPSKLIHVDKIRGVLKDYAPQIAMFVFFIALVVAMVLTSSKSCHAEQWREMDWAKSNGARCWNNGSQMVCDP